MSNIFGNSIQMMGKSLDYLWLKQGVTSNNIANGETPGYKAQYVTFEETFRQQLETAMVSNNENTINNAIMNVSPTVHESTAEGTRLDGNNVNTEVEMIELTRVALQYQTELNSINSDITRIRTAIKGQ